MKTTRIILADDHHMFRAGIKSLLESQENCEVVGEAENGTHVIQLAKEVKADLVLMDNHLPMINGIEAAKKILAHTSHLNVIILSAQAEIDEIMKMMKSGAKGYLLKNTSFQELLQAIKTVQSGKPYLSKEITDKLFFSAQQVSTSQETEAPDANIPISKREFQILRMITDEKTNKEIAQELNISRRTVDTHRRNLLQKLNAKNTAGLVRFYMNWKNQSVPKY